MCIFLINLYMTDFLYTQFLNKEPVVWPTLDLWLRAAFIHQPMPSWCANLATVLKWHDLGSLQHCQHQDSGTVEAPGSKDCPGVLPSQIHMNMCPLEKMVSFRIDSLNILKTFKTNVMMHHCPLFFSSCFIMHHFKKNEDMIEVFVPSCFIVFIYTPVIRGGNGKLD